MSSKGGLFFLPDVFSHRTFCRGTFCVPPDVCSLRTICPSGRFVARHFVWAPIAQQWEASSGIEIVFSTIGFFLYTQFLALESCVLAVQPQIKVISGFFFLSCHGCHRRIVMVFLSSHYRRHGLPKRFLSFQGCTI